MVDLRAFEAWLVQANRSKHTLRGYLADVREFFLWFTADPLTVQRKDLDAYLQILRERPGRNGKLSPKSINKKVNGISSFFKWLVYTDALKASPRAGLVLPKSGKREVEPLTRDDIEKMRAVSAHTFRQRLDALVLELFYASGCRLGDLETARLANYNPARRTIVVIAKGNKQLKKRLTVGAQDMLTVYLASLSPALPADRPLLVYEDGRQYPRNQIYLSIKRIAKKALPWKRVYPHLLRHTAITHRYEQGEDIKALQKFAGHSSIATTDFYTHLSDKLESNNMDQFDPDRKPESK
jgi:site-specific recombinase XerD